MLRNILGAVLLGGFAVVGVPGGARPAQAQEGKTPYPSMAPLEQYLMERKLEVALARSAAPESISRDAEVMVLGGHGYETVFKGRNGFVCLVQRSWTAGSDDPDFWNPRLRAAICFNPPAARTYLPNTIKRTELVLAGRSKAQMFEGIKAALDNKELPALEAGAMCYMMSKQSYLSDRDGNWHSHLMFFLPLMDPAAWGTGLPGSPVILGIEDTADRMTVFWIPVAKWSDGTAAPLEHH
ncbi:MAG: hypothetical protein ABSG16_21285 [Candidatus Acidiferrum sp.]|jgi:hypothetical protein